MFLSGITAGPDLLGEPGQRENLRERSAGVAKSARRAGHARNLQQQSSNQFNACAAQDYIYSGPTMDSIFDELTVKEYQSVTQLVVSHFHEQRSYFSGMAIQSKRGVSVGVSLIETSILACGQYPHDYD